MFNIRTSHNRICLLHLILLAALLVNISALGQSKKQNTLANGDPAREIIELLEKKKLEIGSEIDSMVKRNPTIFLGLKDSIQIQTQAIKLSNKRLVGEDLSYLDLRGLDLSGADLRYASLVSTDLTGANLEGANFQGAIMEGAILDSANAIGANFIHTLGTNITARNVDFTNAQLQTAYWPHSFFENTKFINSAVSNMNFNGAYFNRTLFQSSELSNNSFWGSTFEECAWDNTRTCENNFRATTIFNSGWLGSNFENNEFQKYLMVDNVASNTLLQYNKYGGDIRPFVYGFIRTKNGILTNSFNSERLEITNMNTSQLMKAYADHYQDIKIKSYYYWNIAAEIIKLESYFLELEKARIRNPIRYDSFISAFMDSDGNVSIHDNHPSEVVWNQFYSDLREHFITENLKRENNTKLPDFSPSDDTQSDSNQAPSNVPLPSNSSNIPTMGSFEWANVAYLSFSKRFDPKIFSGIDDVRNLLDTKNYVDAIEKISRNQDVILKAAHDASLDLNPTSFFRARRTNNAKINHVIGSVDFSLRGINRIDNPTEKRKLSAKLSEQLGESHLVILEELIWVEEGKSIHSASDAIRFQSRNRFNEIVPKYKPPLDIEHYNGELPKQINVVQLNTYFINGVRVGAKWGKPWASAQHIHVSIKNPEQYLPNWAKNLLNERWKFYSDDVQSDMDKILKQKIQPYFPDELIIVEGSSSGFMIYSENIISYLKKINRIDYKVLFISIFLILLTLYFYKKVKHK